MRSTLIPGQSATSEIHEWAPVKVFSVLLNAQLEESAYMIDCHIEFPCLFDFTVVIVTYLSLVSHGTSAESISIASLFLIDRSAVELHINSGVIFRSAHILINVVHCSTNHHRAHTVPTHV